MSPCLSNYRTRSGVSSPSVPTLVPDGTGLKSSVIEKTETSDVSLVARVHLKPLYEGSLELVLFIKYPRPSSSSPKP